MSYKNIEDRRKYDREFYHKKTDDWRLRKKSIKDLRREELRRAINDYKIEQVCRCCGESDSDLLAFHHLFGKDFCIANAANSGYSLKKIMEEIKKCILLCANCHVKFHSGRGPTAKPPVLEAGK